MDRGHLDASPRTAKLAESTDTARAAATKLTLCPPVAPPAYLEHAGSSHRVVKDAASAATDGHTHTLERCSDQTLQRGRHTCRRQHYVTGASIRPCSVAVIPADGNITSLGRPSGPVAWPSYLQTATLRHWGAHQALQRGRHTCRRQHYVTGASIRPCSVAVIPADGNITSLGRPSGPAGPNKHGRRHGGGGVEGIASPPVIGVEGSSPAVSE